jgi:signal transduction histidine kinase/CheY-like chemotaxis protein
VALRATTRFVAGLAAGVLAALPLAAQTGGLGQRVSLERVNERRASDYAPVMDGQAVTVQGLISARPTVYQFFSHLAIQDEDGRGLVLEGPPAQFKGLRAGDLVEAAGTVSKRAGLPVLVVSRVQALVHDVAPAPKRVAARDLHSFRNLGLLVETEGRVVDKGENTSGEYLLIGDVKTPLKILLPSGPGVLASLDRFEIGDSVRATGIASQYCPFAPYSRSFQVVLARDDDVVLLRTRWLISPEWFAVLLASLIFALGLWWLRERRMSAQQKMVRTFYALGEEVIGVGAPLEIAQRLAAALPGALNLSGLHLYLYNRSSKALDRIDSRAEGGVFSVALQAVEGSLPLGPAAAFRNQALLTIPDVSRSPFFPDGRAGRRPGSLMFVPLFAESEVVGILELYDWKIDHDFRLDERVLTQHLGNQIGIALRLMEEKSVREQLFRSEKLAAVGQLVSGIASELRLPLQNISSLAENIAGATVAVRRSDFQAISNEAHKASDIVARLVSFMQPEGGEPKRFELNGMVHSLIEFRRQEWLTRGFEIQEILSPTPVYVLGSQGQIERVLLDLLVQAEHALSDSLEKRLIIATSILARRVLVEIEYTMSPAKASWEGLSDAEVGLHADGVSRGVVRSHGGELRLARSAQGACRFEVELPVAPARVAETEGAVRAFTCLVVEPDGSSREELVRMLTQRGCRVIPAVSGEDGAELAQRLRFDIVFCAVRLPGLNWIELSEGIPSGVGGFVLLTEGFDYELSRGLLNADNHLLSKPIMEAELDQLLAAIESRVSTNETRLLVVRPDRKVAGNLF